MRTLSLLLLLPLLLTASPTPAQQPPAATQPATGQALAGPSMQELDQLESALRRDGPTALEQVARDLLKQYPQAVDQGKVYYEAAMAFGQGGIRTYVKEYAQYADKALTCPQDGYCKLRLYVFYGDSLLLTEPGPLEEWRPAAAEKYLNALRVALDEKMYFQEPVGPTFPGRPPPELFQGMSAEQLERTRPLREEWQRKNSEYAAAQFKFRRLESAVPSRRLAYGHIVDLYSRPPTNMAELRKLASRILENDKAVDDLVAVTQQYVGNRDGVKPDGVTTQPR